MSVFVGKDHWSKLLGQSQAIWPTDRCLGDAFTLFVALNGSKIIWDSPLLAQFQQREIRTDGESSNMADGCQILLGCFKSTLICSRPQPHKAHSNKTRTDCLTPLCSVNVLKGHLWQEPMYEFPGWHLHSFISLPQSLNCL